jgi:Domain of unknown function (DUF4389)
VAQHPVRVVVSDDLHRSRLTVLLRLILAIPHFIWISLWSIAAVVVVIVNWFATLITGRTPQGLFNFLTAYLRYATHLFAYLGLAANPYPGFLGAPGYPVDAEFDGPEPQRRWVTAFRVLLAVPAFMLAFAFEGSGLGGGFASGHDERYYAGTPGILTTVAFFAWFACLATARMPQGFRNVQAYGLRFLAQVGAYLFVLTDRYPDVDPEEPWLPGPDHPVRLSVADDLRRSRLTVFFRLLLALPHFVWLLLWTVAAFFAAIATWFATLVTGRPPDALHRFLSAYVRYAYHVEAYAALTANPFPGFTGEGGRYPIDVQLPPLDAQSRLVTGFRIFLAIPALAVSSGLSGLLFVCAFLGWFASLALGRMPRALREAQAYSIRYGAQTSAYLFLITERYPFSGPALGSPEPPPMEAAETT